MNDLIKIQYLFYFRFELKKNGMKMKSKPKIRLSFRYSVLMYIENFTIILLYKLLCVSDYSVTILVSFLMIIIKTTKTLQKQDFCSLNYMYKT